MHATLERREFLQLTLAGTAMGMACWPRTVWANAGATSKIISPGCRRSKVKVARIYLGNPAGGWPLPRAKLNLDEDVKSYASAFEASEEELADVDFFVDQLVTSTAQVAEIQDKLQQADGILVIHLSIGIMPMLNKILEAGRPTIVFAEPYSGHEWASFGAVLRSEQHPNFDGILTADRSQLVAAIRPFRALHHLREAKVLNLSTRTPPKFVEEVKTKFGTEIKQIDLDRTVKAYEAVSDADAQAEAEKWIAGATKIVEPAREEIFRSCKLALAFERLLAEEDATVMTVDCYGTMWAGTIRLPAYPCIGFARLNNLGLGGICESDLRSAMTHILFQGLSGRPGFISDPTVDESANSIILAHCMGTPRMDGPNKPPAPYKLRCVMEREEGVVPQVFMRVGEKATQALLATPEQLIYFTGEITEAPDVERGCRTKITAKVDGDVERLWRNWTNGLHRVTCYGDLRQDLTRFCRLAKIEMTDEAA
jgi:L-fucose isomerase-like protein